jgi:predicted DCC family thiol-disulfide oxidoreductase YuxK
MLISSLPRALIVIDGKCILCNNWSKFICRFDRVGYFKITQSQSKLGESIIQHFNLPSNLPTILFIHEGQIYQESTAVIKILSKLKPTLKLITVLELIPSAIRDSLYKWIAHNRYRFFGQSMTCMLLTPRQKKHFLS